MCEASGAIVRIVWRQKRITGFGEMCSCVLFSCLTSIWHMYVCSSLTIHMSLSVCCCIDSIIVATGGTLCVQPA